MARLEGLEPPAYCLEGSCSIQLSYTHHICVLVHGTPEGTRTPGPLLRRQLLYPPELQAHMERVMGIEPTRPAWKAGILPLNYTRTLACQPMYSITENTGLSTVFSIFSGIFFAVLLFRHRAQPSSGSRWSQKAQQRPSGVSFTRGGR